MLNSYLSIRKSTIRSILHSRVAGPRRFAALTLVGTILLAASSGASADCWRLHNGQVTQTPSGAKAPQPNAVKVACPSSATQHQAQALPQKPPQAPPQARPQVAPHPQTPAVANTPKPTPLPAAPVRSAFTTCDRIVSSRALGRRYTNEERGVINRCIADYRRQAADAEAKVRTYDKQIAALHVVEKTGEYAEYGTLALSGLQVVTAGAGAARVLLVSGGKPVAKAAVVAKISEVRSAASEFAKHIAEEVAMHGAREAISHGK